jgi:phytoene synthase
MSVRLEQSYAWCRGVARSRAKNFYYSFVLLSRPQRDAMCAIYAFMRYCDDLSDSPEAARTMASIERWRGDLARALDGDCPDHPLWPAFQDAVARYRIPPRYFHDMIDGVSSDIDPRPVETFDELYRYCYRVASVVGLTITHIFGFDSPQALELAEKCGVAFQITNILRDVREDSELGRSYLPAEDLRRFGVDLRRLERSEAFLALMRFQASRARAHFEEAMPLVGLVRPESRASLWALIQIYYRLLDRIERSNFDVLARRIRVPTWEKLWIVLRGLVIARRFASPR